MLGIRIRNYYWLKDLSLNKDMPDCAQPAFYGMLEKIVRHIPLTPDDVFVDIGCGEGRVVFFMALHKVKKSIGIEIDPAVIDAANKNLCSFKKKHAPIEFVNADATKCNLSEGNIFYLFSPFGEKTLATVLHNIKESLAPHPRKIRIVYVFPLHRHLVDRQDWLVREGNLLKNGACPVWCNT